jgi:hypothetical protein
MEHGTYDPIEASKTVPKASTSDPDESMEEEDEERAEESDDSEESESDDEEYLAFIDDITAKIRKGNGLPPLTEADDRRHQLKNEHTQLKRLLHTADLEVSRIMELKGQVEFRRTEHTRITHYWARMQQIKAIFANQGIDVDLDGDGKLVYDGKRAKDALPPPEPEPPIW